MDMQLHCHARNSPAIRVIKAGERRGHHAQVVEAIGNTQKKGSPRRQNHITHLEVHCRNVPTGVPFTTRYSSLGCRGAVKDGVG